MRRTEKKREKENRRLCGGTTQGQNQTRHPPYRRFCWFAELSKLGLFSG
jgi:hypothetical protein